MRPTVWLIAMPVVLASCGRAAREAEPSAPQTITLKSEAFADGATIPKQFTCDGRDTSPPLAWDNVPTACRELALVCEDPDAPAGTWTHWVMYHLPATIKGLKPSLAPEPTVEVAEGVRADQGRNDFGKPGYGGPCPPSGTHRYVFHLYALDARPDLAPGATKAQLLKAVQGHVLAEGRLTGRYGR